VEPYYRAGSKGTGKWTVQLAADSGVAAPSISAALEARFVSAKLELRQLCQAEYGAVAPDASKCAAKSAAAFTSGGGGGSGVPAAAAAVFTEEVASALYAAKVIAYAQGFSLLSAAGEEHGWGLRLGELARIWRGGCIIRARLLDTIIAAYARDPDLGSLLLDPAVSAAVKANVGSLRSVVLRAVESGVPVPALTSALQYFDAMRRGRGPANIIQAQRDAFGAHTFKRTDAEGSFHAEW
jgi:6-phosphogluconate dehydrogenase